MDTVVYKSERFRAQSILDIKTHFKPTETFQYTHFSSSHPPGVEKGFVKREALRLLRTSNSSRKISVKRTLLSSNHVSLLEVIQTIWLRHSYQLSNSQKGYQHRVRVLLLRITCTYCKKIYIGGTGRRPMWPIPRTPLWRKKEWQWRIKSSR